VAEEMGKQKHIKEAVTQRRIEGEEADGLGFLEDEGKR
jgi:hypothetical protein